MADQTPERVIAVTWGEQGVDRPASIRSTCIEACDRQGLLRDISEVFAKEKMNVIGVQTQSRRTPRRTAWMTFTSRSPTPAAEPVLDAVARSAASVGARR
jgi:GTP pyrophosphokinase